MPSLPITFKDLQNLDIPARVAAQKNQTPEMPQIDPQAFLATAVENVKKQFGTTEGLIDTGLAINPVTRAIDMGAKFFGAKGIQEGFQDGVIQPVGDGRSGRSEVRIPPLMF